MGPFDFSTGTTNPETFPHRGAGRSGGANGAHARGGAQHLSRIARSRGPAPAHGPARVRSRGSAPRSRAHRADQRLDAGGDAGRRGAVRGPRRRGGDGGVLLLRHDQRLPGPRHRAGGSAGGRPRHAHRRPRERARRSPGRGPRPTLHLRARHVSEPHRLGDAARAAPGAAAHRAGAPLHRGGGQLLRRRPLRGREGARAVRPGRRSPSGVPVLALEDLRAPAYGSATSPPRPRSSSIASSNAGTMPGRTRSRPRSAPSTSETACGSTWRPRTAP